MIRYAMLSSTGEPENIDEALQDEDWKKAMMKSTWH
jgi:hypothetical protein